MLRDVERRIQFCCVMRSLQLKLGGEVRPGLPFLHFSLTPSPHIPVYLLKCGLMTPLSAQNTEIISSHHPFCLSDLDLAGAMLLRTFHRSRYSVPDA